MITSLSVSIFLLWRCINTQVTHSNHLACGAGIVFRVVPVGPPILLPIYFHLENLYFAFKRREWWVSTGEQYCLNNCMLYLIGKIKYPLCSALLWSIYVCRTCCGLHHSSRVSSTPTHTSSELWTPSGSTWQSGESRCSVSWTNCSLATTILKHMLYLCRMLMVIL